MSDLPVLRISNFAPPGKPGQNDGEFVAPGDMSMKELLWTPHFRHLLSNRDTTHPFTMDEFVYQSIEHYFQDKKWGVVYPEQAGYFSRTGKFGKHPMDTITAMTGRKRLIMTPDQANFWDAIKVEVQYEAFRAQCREWPFKWWVLRNTGHSRLMGMLQGQTQERDFHMYWLEAIRDNIPLDVYASILSDNTPHFQEMVPPCYKMPETYRQALTGVPDSTYNKVFDMRSQVQTAAKPVVVNQEPGNTGEEVGEPIEEKSDVPPQ